MTYTKEQFTAYCVDNFVELYESEIDDEFTFEHYYKLLLEMSLEELRDELPCEDDDLAEVMEDYLKDPQGIIKSYLS